MEIKSSHDGRLAQYTSPTAQYTGDRWGGRAAGLAAALRCWPCSLRAAPDLQSSRRRAPSPKGGARRISNWEQTVWAPIRHANTPPPPPRALKAVLDLSPVSTARVLVLNPCSLQAQALGAECARGHGLPLRHPARTDPGRRTEPGGLVGGAPLAGPLAEQRRRAGTGAAAWACATELWVHSRGGGQGRRAARLVHVACPALSACCSSPKPPQRVAPCPCLHLPPVPSAPCRCATAASMCLRVSSKVPRSQGPGSRTDGVLTWPCAEPGALKGTGPAGLRRSHQLPAKWQQSNDCSGALSGPPVPCRRQHALHQPRRGVLPLPRRGVWQRQGRQRRQVHAPLPACLASAARLPALGCACKELTGDVQAGGCFQSRGVFWRRAATGAGLHYAR